LEIKLTITHKKIKIKIKDSPYIFFTKFKKKIHKRKIQFNRVYVEFAAKRLDMFDGGEL